MLLAREMMKFWYTCHRHAVQANMESALSCDPSMMPLTTCLQKHMYTYTIQGKRGKDMYYAGICGVAVSSLLM